METTPAIHICPMCPEVRNEGPGVAYGYSLVALIFPGVFPPSFREADDV